MKKPGYLTLLIGASALSLISCCGAAGKTKIEVKNAMIMEVPSVQKNTGAFMEIFNHSGADDTLVSAKSNISEVTEIHKMVEDGDTMRMEKIDSIVVPAGSSAVLKRGGFDIMLIGLTKEIKDGDIAEINLNFKKAGNVKLEVPVKKLEM